MGIGSWGLVTGDWGDEGAGSRRAGGRGEITYS